MHSKKDCVKLIEKVRTNAADPESAYLLRTRIKRSILSAARLAAEQLDIKAPRLPAPVALPAAASGLASAVIVSCNGLIAKTRELCQPSEALDSRWRKGWEEVVKELEVLQAAVEAMPPHGG